MVEGLVGPEGLAVDGDRLLVVETGMQQVTAIDLATGETSPVITGFDVSTPPLEAFLPNGGVSGVTVGPDGAIYATDAADIRAGFGVTHRASTAEHRAR